MMTAGNLADFYRRAIDSDVFFSFRNSPVTMGAATITAICLFAAAFAPFIAPQDPYDLGGLRLMDAFTPPAWESGGTAKFLLGTDDQGRDMLSTIIYGTRLSLGIGFGAVGLAALVGVVLGLVSGFVGGITDSIIMRVAEVQLSFPAILIALLVDGVLRGVIPFQQLDAIAIYVVILSIGISTWPQYARTVRALTMVEKTKEYIQAAQVIGLHPSVILFRHILGNVMGPVLVIATIQLAIAIILEATLSFLGVGIPPTQPSLGTLIRVGNDYLFSGEWWITAFPGAMLAVLIISVNLLGDWLRDIFNPKLR